MDILKNDRVAVRRFLMDANRYVPSRQDKNAVTFLRSPIAEQDANGPLAEWLAINMSKIIGRKVDAQYALLLLVNWAARSGSKSFMLLKRVSNALNVFFHHPSGILVPNVGFGTGMTDVKLKIFARQLIEHMIKPLVIRGRDKRMLSMDVDGESSDDNADYDEIVDSVGCENTCELARENKDIVIASSKLLSNNDVFKHKTVQQQRNNENTHGDKTCDCECHGVGKNLAGLTFHPCEDRRLIYEQEYSKTLNSQPYLLAEFGVCGYQHRLTASSDKKTLVSLQLLKERLIYIQREAAAAINWSRLLQFFLTSGSARDQNNVQEKLYSMNRKYIEHFSTVVRNGIACDRIISDLITKFNTEILPLGRSPDSFLRTKAGLTIIEHATQVLTRHYHHTSQLENIRDININTIPKKLLAAAERCVTGRDLSRSYNVDIAFLVPYDGNYNNKFKPIPFFGVHNPIYPANSNEYEDNTAQKCSSQKSEFWIRANEINSAEALVSKGVISLPKVVNNIESSSVIFSENNSCGPIFEGLYSMFKKDVSTEKPRKQDDHTPWSSKNTGQSGRNATEFSINSVIVVADYEKGINGDPEDDIFLSAVDNQRITAQNDILYPDKKKHPTKGFSMIKAPDYAPIYRHGGKTAVIVLK